MKNIKVPRFFGRQNFNDTVALFLLVVIPAMWILDARGWVTLNREVAGSLIVTWTIIIQYYFRRAPPENGAPKPLAEPPKP